MIAPINKERKIRVNENDRYEAELPVRGFRYFRVFDRKKERYHDAYYYTRLPPEKRFDRRANVEQIKSILTEINKENE